MKRLLNLIKKIRGNFNYYFIKWRLFGYERKWNKVNLCGGGVKIQDYCDVDLYYTADVNIDLEKKLLPFKDNSIDTLICISAINYFNRKRGEEIIKDVYRILKKGGVVRFASQDLKAIAYKYVNRDNDFFFQKRPNGQERFQGETMADKINAWFYGYKTAGGNCKYFYDFETLALIFKKAGFSKIEEKKYMQSMILEIAQIDNRQDQMFFLEAFK